MAAEDTKRGFFERAHGPGVSFGFGGAGPTRRGDDVLEMQGELFDGCVRDVDSGVRRPLSDEVTPIRSRRRFASHVCLRRA
jgi:hypothetical protein